MKKLLMILNPTAGQRKAPRQLTEILTVFNQGGYEVTIYITAYSGHAQEIVTQRAAEFDLVVCAGGDGTLNETISGMLCCGADVPIGYIPAGTTNDFASTLNLPTDPVKAAQLIMEGNAERYDIGQFGGRYFTYIASFGAFTRVSYSTPQNVKNSLGHLAYILESIQELSKIRSTRVRFQVGDEIIEDDFVFGSVSNSTCVGGVLTLDPKRVDLQDGKLELLLVRAPKNHLELAECLRAFQDQTYNCAMVTFRSVSDLTIFPDPEMLWSLDGERAEGMAEIPVSNLHRAVNLICHKEEPEC